MADVFFRLSDEERREVLKLAASRSGRPAHLLEKDVWVVWSLATLYASDFGQGLVFKGGTSLSKAYKVIRRFSEDVDLTYDIRELMPDLVGQSGDGMPPTLSQQKRWTDEVRKRLPEWVKKVAKPAIVAALEANGILASTRAEGEKLFIDYAQLVDGGTSSVAPSVMLEFGARSTGEPATTVSFR